MHRPEINLANLQPSAVLEGVLARFDELGSDESMIVEHVMDPQRLTEALDAARPREVEWSPLDRGPTGWRVELTRRRGAASLLADVLSRDHRRLDDLVSTAETDVAQGLLRSAARYLVDYHHSLDRHMQVEERFIYSRVAPAVAETLKLEHRVLRRLVGVALEAIRKADRSTFFRAISDLHEMEGMHTQREEHEVFPLVEGLLSPEERSAAIAQLHA